MINDSRTALYEYLYGLFFDVVTKNVYMMREPQDLTKSDTTDGFLVVRVGDVNDASEFRGEAYGWAVCFVEAFIPQISRGRLNMALYNTFEEGISNVIDEATNATTGIYHVHEGSVVSLDGDEMSTANNAYFVFVKSFVVQIDAQES